ncbi:hypothetical protein AKO1_013775, partial [Acrasis kona]
MMTLVNSLHDACKSGSLAQLQNLLEEVISKPGNMFDINGISIASENGCSLLHVATRYNNIEVMDYLLSIGANIECKDKTSATPLNYAACDKCVDVLAALVGKGANINYKDCYEITPLWTSIRDKQFKAAETLLFFKADINAKVTARGCTPLHAACELGNIDAVRYLLKEGASLTKPDRNNEICLFTSLHDANIVDCICQAAVQQNILMKLVTTVNEKGENIFHALSNIENPDVKSLDVIVNYILGSSYTTLMRMMNVKDKKSLNTPLHHAIKCKKVEVAQALCKYNSYIHFDAQNHEGDTPLMSSVRCNCNDTREILVDLILGADRQVQGFFSENEYTGLNVIELAEDTRRTKSLQRLLQFRSTLDVTPPVNIISQEVKNLNFTCMIMLNDNLPNQTLIDELNSLTDNFYNANCAVIAVVSLDDNNVSEIRNQNEINFRIINDRDRGIATQYAGYKSANLVRRLSKFVIGVERRMSVTSSPKSTSPKGSQSPSKLSTQHINYESETVDSIVMIDHNENTLYSIPRPEASRISDIVRVLSYYVQCAHFNPCTLDHKMEPKSDIFDWVLQNDYICRLFATQLKSGDDSAIDTVEVMAGVGLQKHINNTIAGKKRKNSNPTELNLLYQNYIEKQGGKLNVVMENYNHGKKMSEAENLRMKNDLRRHAFKHFIQTQQFAEQSGTLVRKASKKDLSE